MQTQLRHLPVRALVMTSLVMLCTASRASAQTAVVDESVARAQAPAWSASDMQFFLHGSMGDEFVPEAVYRGFRATYPNLFPGMDLTGFGLVADARSDLPVGISRRNVRHLANLPSLGINCSSCHSAEMVPSRGGAPIRVLGATAHFDVEAFFGAIVGASFLTADPANMEKFLPNYLVACEPGASISTRALLDRKLKEQKSAIANAIKSCQADEAGAKPDRFFDWTGTQITLSDQYLEKGGDLVPVVRGLLRLFHNMRVALHVPNTPPDQAPPASGPGRNNAFGILTLALFGEQSVYGPAKFGLVWNLEHRTWVHWDGNTRSPITRNLAAALGLGAPLLGKHGDVDFAQVDRFTRLTEKIQPPKYPWKIDTNRATRGSKVFADNCASCHVHTQADEDKRLCALGDIGTDPNRARLFTDHHAGLYNKFFAELEVSGYKPPPAPIRSTQKYIAVDLAGVWARAPYLHNGSVRTMRELLTPAAMRAKSFHRGSRNYVETEMGYEDAGPYTFDATSAGNSAAGHEYGIALPEDQKRDLIEYLKSL